MSTWDTSDEYFSGQGIVLMAQRGTDGKPMGFLPVGNVPALKISLATSTLEHKESKTGQRGIDLRLTTEVKASMSMTVENFSKENLAQVMRGSSVKTAATPVVGAEINGYIGKVTALPHIKVASVTIKQGATSLVAYADETTAWDYKLNADAGSIQLNDGAGAAGFSGLGTAVTGVAVGATTTFTMNNTLAVGDLVYLYGFAGADAGQLNGQTFAVSAADATTFTIALDTTGDTITFASAKAIAPADPIELTADYTPAVQYEVGAMTEGARDVYIRFEGLNTANESSPVVVEVFKFSTDPLKELDLISDGVQQFVVEGSVLLDPTRTTGSKYYSVKKL